MDNRKVLPKKAPAAKAEWILSEELYPEYSDQKSWSDIIDLVIGMGTTNTAAGTEGLEFAANFDLDTPDIYITTLIYDTIVEQKVEASKSDKKLFLRQAPEIGTFDPKGLWYYPPGQTPEGGKHKRAYMRLAML